VEDKQSNDQSCTLNAIAPLACVLLQLTRYVQPLKQMDAEFRNGTPRSAHVAASDRSAVRMTTST